MKHVQIVIPVYNEEGNVVKLIESIENEMNALTYTYSVIFIDDGSSDQTLEHIKTHSAKKEHIQYLSFSKNFGHQHALKAGLDYSTAQAVISMDGDMQHPAYLIKDLLINWENGYDVVYTIREDDKKLPLFKRYSSKIFYHLMNKVSGLSLQEGVADFRLLDKKVVDEIRKINESDLFFRGLINWIGFKQTGIKYKPEARFSGKSKYTLKKMCRFALQGITSFSIRPLYLSVFIGVGISATTFFLYFIYLLLSIYFKTNISGWASLISTIVFFGGLNLIVLGIIGIYVGKSFMQGKNRPTYIVNESNLKNG
jgi:polyisoprenyl-phosphate glycosyltransferase